MIGDPFTMVVAIVLIVTIGKVLSSRHKARHAADVDENAIGNTTQRISSNPDTQGMQDEIRALKERIQVLERIATDTSSANDLNRQIEELRSR
ncbi:hypothetical protein [Sphingorhabdus sp.]|uniref:hypothetical protein n=1 Tax=Sphingorhabdus sp. TaxID=1902408 RepID=UPI003918FC2E